MREIKFRGMNTDGEWLYGDLIHQDGLSTIVPADCYASIEDSFVMAAHERNHLLESRTAGGPL